MPDTIPTAPTASASAGPDIPKLLSKNKLWLALGLAAGLAVGVAMYIQLGPTYEASAQVIVQKRVTAQVKDDRVETAGDRREHLQLIMSPLIVGEAVRVHKLSRLKSFKGEDDPTEDILIALKARRVSGDDRSYTNLLELSYRSKTQKDSSHVLNAVIEAYRNYLGKSQNEFSTENMQAMQRMYDKLLSEKKAKDTEYIAFQKKAPLQWKTAPGESGQAGDTTNVFQEEAKKISEERAKVTIRKAEVQSRLQAISDARDRGDERLMLEMLVRRYSHLDQTISAGEVETATKKPELIAYAQQNLMPLLEEERKLLRDYGADHPEVKNVRLAIDRAIDYFSRMGVELLDPHNKKATSARPETNFVDAYISSLKVESEELIARDNELESNFNEAMKNAKELTIFMVEHKSRNDEISRLTDQLNDVGRRLSVLTLGKDDAGYILRVVAPPKEGIDLKKPMKIIGGGAVGGLGMVLGIIYLLALLDKRVKNVEQVQKLLPYPILGRVPTAEIALGRKQLGSRLESGVFLVHAPASAVAEAIRSVRAAVLVGVQGAQQQILQITSCEPGDGKTTLSCNLAVALAQSGKRVLLIDADLRRPRVDQAFGLPRHPGLADVLLGEFELGNAVQTTEVGGLAILCAGTPSNSPAELFALPRFAELLAEARGQYDFVLVDTPPLLAVSDPCDVARHMDGLILVAQLEKNTSTNLLEARRTLETHEARMLGVVVQGGHSTASYRTYSQYRAESKSPATGSVETASVIWTPPPREPAAAHGSRRAVNMAADDASALVNSN